MSEEDIIDVSANLNINISTQNGSMDDAYEMALTKTKDPVVVSFHNINYSVQITEYTKEGE